MRLEIDGPPSRWVAAGGRPASAIRGAHDGMKSFESDHGTLLVMDVLVAQEIGGTRTVGTGAAAIDDDLLLLSRRYGEVCLRSVLVGDHELAALHDDPDAVWSWRPIAYRIRHNGVIQRFGSQQELAWRWGLAETIQRQHDRDAAVADLLLDYAQRDETPTEEEFKAAVLEILKSLRAESFEFVAANERARTLLLENLSPLQRLELVAWGSFHVRGTINGLYRIELGNGAAIVDPVTGEALVSLCLHPERWMPSEDVALATKLLIESGPAGEREMLEGARPRRLPPPRVRASRLDRRAWELERDLLPRPLRGDDERPESRAIVIAR